MICIIWVNFWILAPSQWLFYGKFWSDWEIRQKNEHRFQHIRCFNSFHTVTYIKMQYLHFCFSHQKFATIPSTGIFRCPKILLHLLNHMVTVQLFYCFLCTHLIALIIRVNNIKYIMLHTLHHFWWSTSVNEKRSRHTVIIRSRQLNDNHSIL